jgi:uncharacterized protein YjbI with pentapeptide repeats
MGMGTGIGSGVGTLADGERDRLGLRADCGSCFALCCVALAFSTSAGFAADKPVGEPCANLREDYSCGIHARLREEGYSGCTVFDCLGAGQQVSQVTFGGRDWRRDRQTAQAMFAAFPVMRQLHELLWYLTEALDLAVGLGPKDARSLEPRLRSAIAETEKLTHADAADLLTLDVPSVRAQISALLLEVSELVRGRKQNQSQGRSQVQRGNLVGARLARADLRAANLRGALLIAADLRGADLRRADVIGADFRDADLRGADLTGCLFLTQAQLDSAKGDAATRLPGGFRRPEHWTRVTRT